MSDNRIVLCKRRQVKQYIPILLAMLEREQELIMQVEIENRDGNRLLIVTMAGEE